MIRTCVRSHRLGALLESTALVVSLAGLAAVSHPYVARAALPVLPQGGTVVVGAASIASTSPGALNVTTATNHTAITWNSFSIGAGATVAINQPSASAVTLNEVTGANPSRIFGSLTSNGQVVLANPNGIWFGPGSHVDVASLVASTATASQAALEAFAKGGALMLDQAGNPSASIVNDGSISIGAEGLAGLVAPGVANNGVIAAKLGHVVLASGTVATLDFYGDGLISFAVGGSVTATPKDQAGKALAAAVTNSGSITAPGGTVLLTAAAAKTVVDNTINMSGVVVASAIAQNGGEIDLEGGSGTTNVSGTLQASSKTGTGGTIDVTGKSVQLAAIASLTANGTSGGTIAVGGGVHGGGSLAHASDVSIAQGATLTADGTTGTGGTISVWSDGATQVAASLTAIGALPGGLVETSGETLDFGGISVKASNWLLDPINLELTQSDQTSISSALNADTNVTIETTSSGAVYGGIGTNVGTQTSGAGNITVDAASSGGISWTTGASLELSAYGSISIAANASIHQTVSTTASLALIADNTGTGTGTVSIGSGASVSLAGTASIYYNPTSYSTPTAYSSLVHAGSLYAFMLINTPANLSSVIADFSAAADYALGRDIDASSLGTIAPLGEFDGVLDGQNHAISNLTISGGSDTEVGLFTQLWHSGLTQPPAVIENLRLLNETVSSTTSGSEIGGIVGANYATLDNDMTSGTITGSAAGTLSVGGLAGYDGILIENSYSSASIVVSGGNGTAAGGLVGVINGGTLETSYFAGTVHESSGEFAAGLVGAVDSGGLVEEDYFIGTVSAVSNYAGGLAGFNDSASTVTNSYAAGSVSNSNSSGGLVGDNIGSLTDSVWDEGATNVFNATGSGSSGPNVAGFSGTSAYTLSVYNSDLTGGVGTSASDTWYMVDGTMRPILEAEYSTTITNTHQLELINLSLSAAYTLADNIDASATSLSSDVWNPTDGFTPIGFNSGAGTYNSVPRAFIGTLNGLGYAITGLQISFPTDNDIGLFSDVGNGATISNLSLSGSVSGINNTLNSAFAKGTGLLAGQNSGTITGVYAFVASGATDLITADWDVGGLVGVNISGGSIVESGALVPVTGESGGSATGGLVGDNFGTIESSDAGGAVTAGGGDSYQTGGLVGTNESSGTILDSSATGVVTAPIDAVNIGGLVGENTGLVSASFATGLVSATGGSVEQIGGLVGQNSGTVIESYASGLISLNSGDDTVGGLVGLDGSTIINSYATGSIVGGGSSQYVGGLVGADGGTLMDSFATGAVSVGANSDSIGVLVGSNEGGTVLDSYGAGAVSVGSGSSNVGGLIGSNSGSVDSSSAVTTLTSLEASLFTGFSTSVWADASGQTTPYLIANPGPAYLSGEGMTLFSGIGTAAQLEALSPTGDYYLANAIDASSISNFTPIGYSTSDSNMTPTPFTGKLDGLGFTVSNLDIDFAADNLGLISEIGSGGEVLDLILSGSVTATGSVTNAGLLAGENAGGLVSGVSVSGSVAGVGLVGGLVGFNNSGGSIASAFSSATVSSTGGTAGGLVGFNGDYNAGDAFGTITDSGASGAVTATGTGDTGGLAGYNAGLILDSFATGSVTGGSDSGGLVGLNTNYDYAYIGTIIGSYATGTVSGSSAGGAALGGLVGWSEGTVDQSWASGAVVGNNTSASDNLGGLIGLNEASGTEVLDSYAIGAVSGLGNLGGLVGYNEGATITNAYALGSLTGSSGSSLGGLVGENSGTVTSSDWDTQVVAGGVGSNSGSFNATGLSLAALEGALPSGFSSSIWADGQSPSLSAPGSTPFLLNNLGPVYTYGNGTTVFQAVSTAAQLEALAATGDYYLANAIDASSISNFTPIGYSTSDSNMTPTPFTGKLDGLGFTVSGLTISNTSASNLGLFSQIGTSGVVENLGLVGGSVTGSTTGERTEGMLAGENDGLIYDDYATGSVTGFNEVGGLVGRNLGVIELSYATGSVSGYQDIGGLVGNNGQTTGGTIETSYAGGSVSGGTDVGGLVGSQSGGALIDQSYAYQSDAEGSVSGTGDYIGGLVGTNGVVSQGNGTITNSYALGSVEGSGSSANIGGLVGINLSGSSIVDSFATGAVFGESALGLLVGTNAGVITDVAWASDTNLDLQGIGTNSNPGGTISATGLSLAALEAVLPTGFSSSGDWADGQGSGQSTPFLLNNPGPVYTAGNGTSVFLPISGVAGLENFTNTLDSTMGSGDYYLAGSVDMTGVTGFTPISGVGDTYTLQGIFDGLGYSISHLSITSAATFDSGLFASFSGTVENLSITSSLLTVNSASEYGGILVGDMSGTASNITLINDTIDDVTNSAAQYVGLLAGVGESESSATDITVTGGSISLSQSISMQDIGGAIGSLAGSLASTTVSGVSITTPHGFAIGGVVGDNAGAISGSSVTGAFSVGYTGSSGNGISLGGLVGLNESGGSITSSTVSGGTVSLTESGIGGEGQRDDIAGLVGDNYGSVTSSSVTGTSVAAAFTGSHLTAYIGGLIGYNEGEGGTITDSFATGGIVTVSDSGTANSAYAGGFVGGNSGDIIATGNASDWANMSLSIEASSTVNAGGFVGDNNGGGTISQAYAQGDVDAVSFGSNNGSEGGFVGANYYSIAESFASGSVTGLSNVGGFVGFNGSYDSDAPAQISNSYAVGAVLAGTSVGGFVGDNDATGSIVDAYSTGAVASGGAGFASTNNGIITNSYWDTDTSGDSAPESGVTGEQTAVLEASLATSFGQSDVWSIIPTVSLPYLDWQFSGTPQVVQGNVTENGGGVPGETVGLQVGGSSIASALTGSEFTQTGADGSYYFLLAPGTISSGGQTIATYLAGSSPPPAATIWVDATGSTSSLDLIFSGASTGTITVANDPDASLSAFETRLANGTLFPGLTSFSAGSAFSVSSAGAVTLGTGTSLVLDTTATSFSLDQSYAGTLSLSSEDSVDIGAISVGAGRSLLVSAQAIAATGAISIGTDAVLSLSAATLSLGSINGSGGSTLVLNTTGSLSDTLDVSVANLSLESGSFVLNSDGNSVSFLDSTTSGSVTLADTEALTIGTVSGPLTVNDFGQSIAFDTAPTLQGTTVLTGSTVTFAEGVFGSYGLTIIGNAVFGGPAGSGDTQLGGLSVSGTVDLSGDGAGEIFTSGALSLGAISAGSNPVSLTSFDGTITLHGINSTASLSLSGNVILDSGGYTFSNGSFGVVTLDGTIVLGQATSFGAVTLAADTTISGPTVTFDSTVDGARALTIEGDAVFDDTVGGSVALVSLNVSGTTEIDGDAIQTTGTQIYIGAVTLPPPDPTLTGSTVTFDSTVDGDSDLTIDGNAVFDGAVGSSTALNSLTVTGTTTGTTLAISAGAVSLAAVTATTLTLTTGSLTDSGMVSAQSVQINGSNTAIDIGSDSGGLVISNADLAELGGSSGTNAVSIGNDTSVIIVSGTVTLPKDVELVGASVTFSGATVSGSGDFAIYTDSLATSGSTVTVSQGVTIDSVNSSDPIIVGGTVAGVPSLALTTSTLATFLTSSLTLGSSTDTLTLADNAALPSTATIDVASATAIIEPGAVLSGHYIVDSVSVSGVIYLAGATTVDTHGDNGAINVADVEGYNGGGESLTILAGSGAVTIGEAGASSSLGSVAIVTTGTTTLGSVTTTGAQSYSGPVSLSGSTTTLTGSSIVFGSTIDGASALTVAGNAGFGGAIGGSVALTSLTVTGATTASSLVISADAVSLGAVGASSVAIHTDSLALSATMSAGTVLVDTLGGGGTINLGPLAAGSTSPTLELSTTTLGELGTGSVTVGDTHAAVTLDLNLPSNVTLLYASLTSLLQTSTLQLSGTAYAGYGSTNVLAGAVVDIVLDGHDYTGVSVNSAGLFSTSITTSASGQHDGVIVLVSGGTGAAFYDFTGSTLTGLNVYGGSVFIATDGTSVASAVGRLAGQLSYLTTGAADTGVSSLSTGGVASASGLGLVVDGLGATGTTLALDLPGTSASGTLTFAGSATIVEGSAPITANTVLFNGPGTFILSNSGNQIAAIGNVNAGSAFGSATVADQSTITLGSLTTSGTVSIEDNSVTLGSGAAIQVAGGLDLDTLAAGGAIGIGSSSGTLTLSSALLAGLGATTPVIVGDGSNTITAGGTIIVPGGLTLDGSVVLATNTTVDTTLAGASIVFDGAVNPVNNSLGLTLGAAGDILFNGSVGTTSLRLHSLTITTARNVTVEQAGVNGGTINAQLIVDSFATGGSAGNYGIKGILSVGNHSLESDGDVSIIATTVEGRIVAGNDSNLSVTAQNIVGASATNPSTFSGGTITVAAANDISNSTFTATRSATVGATDSISNTTITAPVATITTANIDHVSINATYSTVNNVTTTSDSGADQQAKNPPQIASLAGLDLGDGGSDDQSDGKHKNGKNGKNGAAKAADKTKHEGGKTYDYANQYVEKLLGSKKPEE